MAGGDASAAGDASCIGFGGAGCSDPWLLRASLRLSIMQAAV